jgi:pullulanase
VSQGVLFFHGGAELARTKGGAHNSYNAPDSVNQIDWNRKVGFADVFDYYKSIIAIRRAHPVFRLETAPEVRRRLRFHEFDRPAENAIIFSLDGRGVPGETWSDTVVLINPEPRELTFRIPLAGTFNVHANDGKVWPEAAETATGSITVGPRSLAILARE